MHRSHRSAPTIETPREKVTVTRRPDSLAYADRKARERGVSRSEIIDAALAEAADREVSPIGQLSAEKMAEVDLALHRGLGLRCPLPRHAPG